MGAPGDALLRAPPAWPDYDPALTEDDAVEVVVQVNGKVRDRLLLPVDLPEDAGAGRKCWPSRRSPRRWAGREPRKVIYVPGRLINIVV